MVSKSDAIVGMASGNASNRYSCVCASAYHVPGVLDLSDASLFLLIASLSRHSLRH